MGKALGAILLAACSCAPLAYESEGSYPSPDGFPIVVPDVADFARSGAPSGAATGPFTLDDALTYAWLEHPDMRAALASIGSARGAHLQASLRPNPELTASYRDEPGEKSTVSLTLEGRVERGAKRRRRAEHARAIGDQAHAQLVETWMRVRARVTTAFVECAHARDVVRLRRRIVEFTDEMHELTRGLVAVGKASRVDLLATRQLLALERGELVAGEAWRDHTERGVLLATGIVPPGADVRIACSLRASAPAPSAARFDVLQRAAKFASPRLASARIAAAVAAARLAMARAGRRRDVNLSLSAGSVERDGGSQHEAYQLGAKSELPVFDRNQGAVISSRYDVARAEAQQRGVHLEVASALSEVLAKLAGLRARSNAYVETILPAAEERLAYSHTQVVADRMSRLDYLAQEVELERTRLQHLAVVRALAVAHARLEEVCGLLTEDR